MRYIGSQPAEVEKNSFTGDGSTTTFDITSEGVAARDGSSLDVQVFVDNVRQEPGSGKSYTLGADGSGVFKRITFDEAPEASAVIYVINKIR